MEFIKTIQEERSENAVSEKEKDLIKKMADGVSNLDDNQKNYVLGLVEGMALAKGEKQQPDSDRPVQ